MACCKTSSGMSKGLQKQIVKKLDDIRYAYPGTRVACVISSNGDIVAQNGAEDAREGMSLVPSLKKSTLEFASTLGQSSCPVVHVKGSSHLFSCYDVGDTGLLLAFFSDMSGPAIALFNTVDADNTMKNILEELALLFNNIVAMSK